MSYWDSDLCGYNNNSLSQTDERAKLGPKTTSEAFVKEKDLKIKGLIRKRRKREVRGGGQEWETERKRQRNDEERKETEQWES